MCAVWISIEHAKRDGTMYDLWVVKDGVGRRVADCYWSYTMQDGKRLPDGPFDGWCCDVGKPGPSSWNPYPNLVGGTATHFMPIPPPPEGASR